MTNTKIRIIKKNDTKKGDANVQNADRIHSESQRKMVRIVAEWAKELQERRREESEVALRRFFPNPAQI